MPKWIKSMNMAFQHVKYEQHVILDKHIEIFNYTFACTTAWVFVRGDIATPRAYLNMPKQWFASQSAGYLKIDQVKCEVV